MLICSLPLLNLGLADYKPFRVDAELVATGRTCIIGSSGSGKSYTVGVFCEELCKNKVPFVMIDIEGEYWGLKEKFEVISIGEGEKCDLRWDEISLEDLAIQAPDSPPLILDLSETDDPKGKVGFFLTALYGEISKRRVPYLVILEEADRFAPQSGERLKIFDEVARRGRKRGLGLMLCTQRPSLVDKNILSQCSNQMIGKLVIQNDLQSVAQFFPERGLPTQLTALSPGIFFALGGLAPTPTRVRIRQRETTHGGITPKLMDRAVRPSAEVLQKLRTSPIEAAHQGSVTPHLQQQQMIKVPRSEHTAIVSSATQPVGQIQAPLVGGHPGLPPLIEREEVPIFIKRQKSFPLFGEEEQVTSVTLTYRPLIEVGVRTRSGVLRKKFETRYMVLDKYTGRIVDWSDTGISFRQDGLERFFGLSAIQIEALKALEPGKDLTLIEVASRSRIPEDLVRRCIRVLEARRLVTSVKIGKAKLVRPLVDIPKVQFMESPLNLGVVSASPPKAGVEKEIKEDEIREVVKGSFEGSDVDTFRPFLYPIYRVELALKSRRRVVLLDGRSGRNLSEI